MTAVFYVKFIGDFIYDRKYLTINDGGFEKTGTYLLGILVFQGMPFIINNLEIICFVLI